MAARQRVSSGPPGAKLETAPTPWSRLAHRTPHPSRPQRLRQPSPSRRQIHQPSLRHVGRLRRRNLALQRPVSALEGLHTTLTGTGAANPETLARNAPMWYSLEASRPGRIRLSHGTGRQWRVEMLRRNSYSHGKLRGSSWMIQTIDCLPGRNHQRNRRLGAIPGKIP